jgi:hypothetical protein
MEAFFFSELLVFILEYDIRTYACKRYHITAEDQLRISEILSGYRQLMTTYRCYLPGSRSENKEEFFPACENEILHCVVQFNYQQEVLYSVSKSLTLEHETHRLFRNVGYQLQTYAANFTDELRFVLLGEVINTC